MIECTVNRKVAVSETKTEIVPMKVLINEEHVRDIQPRVEGGSILTFANQTSVIVAENMTEIKTRLSLPIGKIGAKIGKTKTKAEK